MAGFGDDLGEVVMNSSPVAVIICFNHRYSVNQKNLYLVKHSFQSVNMYIHLDQLAVWSGYCTEHSI